MLIKTVPAFIRLATRRACETSRLKTPPANPYCVKLARSIVSSMSLKFQKINFSKANFLLNFETIIIGPNDSS